MGKSADHDVPVEYLRECFSYDLETGRLTWRDRPRSHFKTEGAWKAWRTRKVGRQTGTSVKGYLSVPFTFEGFVRTAQAHRIAYALQTGEWPPNEIHHNDHERANNRWANLRSMTHAENMRNLARHREPPTKIVTPRLAPDVIAWLKADADQRSLAFIVMQMAREQMAREAKAKKPKR
jgi:hypothetical protein